MDWRSWRYIAAERHSMRVADHAFKIPAILPGGGPAGGLVRWPSTGELPADADLRKNYPAPDAGGLSVAPERLAEAPDRRHRA